MNARRRAIWIGGVAVIAIATLAGAGALWAYRAYAHATSIVRYSADAGEVTVRAATVDGLGTVLVTDRGYALYMYPPDRQHRVTCTHGCQTAWPPLVVSPGARPVAGRGVRAGLLGTDADPGGRDRVVTYHGWPLYTYLGDGKPLHASGQAVDADGGYWYVMRPSGQIVESSPQ